MITETQKTLAVLGFVASLVAYYFFVAFTYDPRPALRRSFAMHQVERWACALSEAGPLPKFTTFDALDAQCKRNRTHTRCALLREFGTRDMWGTSIEVERRGERWVVRGTGPDRAMGTDDDLVSTCRPPALTR